MKEPAPDVVVAGKYCLEGQLASGGMGSVWVARHLNLEMPVAIKFMGPDCASSEEARIRFEREAKAAAYLQSPNVVNVQDYGVDDGLAYIVMELLVGEDLGDRLDRLGRLTLEDTLLMLLQASKALRRAQEVGIVHRDIKPQNLFLAQGGDGEEILKILDFGIAKETGPVLVAKGSNTGQIIGSPHYMSPEHVRGVKDIDHRADLWSLGVIVFECVTGKLPFPSEIVGDVMGMILADPIPLATQVAPDLPPAIDGFFLKALARDRAQRFQSAREMTEAFAEIVGPPSSASSWFPLSQRTPTPAVVSVRPIADGAGAISEPPSSLAPASLAALGAAVSSRDERVLGAAEVGPEAKGTPVKAASALPGARAAEAVRRRNLGAIAAAIMIFAVGGGLLLGRATSGNRAAGNGPSGAPELGSTPVLAGSGATAVDEPAQPNAASTIAEPTSTSMPQDTQPAPDASNGPNAAASGSNDTSGKSPAKVPGKRAGASSPKAPASSKPRRPWGF